jgi:TetR/AcrR family transcriptional regulator, mexJK operon transcriptional repressor
MVGAAMTKARVLQRGAREGRTSASEKRRRDILLAGKKVFSENGYQLASIDRIAEAAGTTKRTVYDHFGSKDGLLAEVVALPSRELTNSLPAPDALPKKPWEGLRTFVARVRKVVSRPQAVRFYRLMIAEAERRPELGRALYETAFRGPERTLAAYLESCIAQGRLKSHGVAVSAWIILDVAAGNPCIRGPTRFLDAAEDQLGHRASDHVVDIMLEVALRLQKTLGGA